MKPSTRDRTEGKLTEVKGKIKEEIGRATNNPDLEVSGNAEKNAGKVQNGSAALKRPSAYSGPHSLASERESASYVSSENRPSIHAARVSRAAPGQRVGIGWTTSGLLAYPPGRGSTRRQVDE